MKILRISHSFPILLQLSIVISFLGCQKQEDNFLSKIPDQSLAIPDQIEKLALLLHNEAVLNSSDPVLGEIASDDFSVATSVFITRPLMEQNIYTWNANPYPNQPINDWNDSYSQIYYANSVLDNLAQIVPANTSQTQYNTVRGSALFFRARAYFNLMQTFTLPYDSAASEQLMGLPLKLNADLVAISSRSSMKACYEQIITDLQTAEGLLPESTSYPTEPNKFAAYGYLARVYLSMHDYNSAFSAADAALSIDNVLSDYNSFTIPALYELTDVSQYPLVEDKFHSIMELYSISTFGRSIPDTLVYNSYDSNDLRKQVYFQLVNGYHRWKGSYEFNQFGYFYDGIAVDELYLTRAECFARFNDVPDAIKDMTSLLNKRYITGTYVSSPITEVDSALTFIIQERRKELLYRGLRWMDLRRLNSDSRFAKTLTRVVNGQSYTLAPGDLRYAFLIPDPEIQASGMIQNAR